MRQILLLASLLVCINASAQVRSGTTYQSIIDVSPKSPEVASLGKFGVEGKPEDKKRIEEAGSGTAEENMLFLDPNEPGAHNESIYVDGRPEKNTREITDNRNIVVDKEFLTSRKSVLNSRSVYYSSALTAIHETLHKYGLSDRYKGKNGLKETPANYKTDIMGEAQRLATAGVSQTHYNNIGNAVLQMSKAKGSDKFISNVVVDKDKFGNLKGQ